MSNDWQYELYVERDHLRGELLRTTFDVLSEHGLIPFQHASEPAVGFTSEGDEVQLTGWPDLERLLERGGGVSLFRPAGQPRDELDGCYFSIVRAEPGRPVWPSPRLAELDTREHDSVLLTFGRSLFANSESRERTASITMRLFLALAKATDAIYGLVLSESGVEELLDHLRLQIPALQFAPPGVLGVANYFRKDYATSIGLNLFQRAGASVRPLEAGLVVELSPHPWELDSQALVAANRRWRAVISQ